MASLGSTSDASAGVLTPRSIARRSQAIAPGASVGREAVRVATRSNTAAARACPDRSSNARHTDRAVNAASAMKTTTPRYSRRDAVAWPERGDTVVAMLWADAAGRTRRPMVAIEDHLYHTGEMLDAIAAASPDRLADLTVCALDRPGPDTAAATADWSARYPAVQIVTLDTLSITSLGAFARGVAGLIRPGGIVVQDVQLTTLPFIPADKWWESIYLAATIRGLFATRPPIVRFCSNKRGYDATFGKDLIDAGFDPRDVMDKTAMTRDVVPAMLRLVRAQFPLELTTTAPGSPSIPVHYLDRPDVEAACDVVLWRGSAGATIGGRQFATPASLRAGAPEIETWRSLVDDRLTNGDGIAVADLGQRLAGTDAARAEQTNVAARHMHGLRARLRDDQAIVTAHHRYRLADRLTVAIV